MSNAVSYTDQELKQFPVEVKYRNDMFYVLCTTFNIMEKDVSLDQAFVRIIEHRKSIIDKMNEFGVTPPNYSKTQTEFSPLSKRKTSVLSKTTFIICIISVLALPVLVYAGIHKATNFATTKISVLQNSIKTQMKNKFGNTEQFSLFLDELSERLDKISPEKKQRLQSSLRKFMTSAKTFTDELSPTQENK